MALTKLGKMQNKHIFFRILKKKGAPEKIALSKWHDKLGYSHINKHIRQKYGESNKV